MAAAMMVGMEPCCPTPSVAADAALRGRRRRASLPVRGRRLSVRRRGLGLVRGCCGLAVLEVARAEGFAVQHPEGFVNVLSGTSGRQEGHSHGNVLPLVAVPWGFNHWSPQTVNDPTSNWFDADADTFTGIRCTHQPSPWIGDYGFFVMRPYAGYSKDEFLGFTPYRAASAIHPWATDLNIGPFGVKMELAPTSHGAALHVSFPSTVPAAKRKICAWIPKGTKKSSDEIAAKRTGIPTGQCHISGGAIDLISRRHNGGIPPDGHFGLYARLEADDNLHVADENTEDASACFEHGIRYVPTMEHRKHTQEVTAEACQQRCASVGGCEHFSFVDGRNCRLSAAGAKTHRDADSVTGPRKCPQEAQAANAAPRHCCFLLGERTRATVRIGTSFISLAQAARALKQEVGGKTYDVVRHEAQMAWRSHLSAVSVEEAGEPSAKNFKKLEIFYTCLYRALLFPRRLDEQTPNGQQHWSPYNGKVMDGPGVTDNGFWDTFRTVYPLLALAYPKQLGEILQGWLNSFKAGGWLPKWASPGYRGMMVGTFADVVLADGIIKNISGFDHHLAWEAIRKDSFESFPDTRDTSRGKVGLDIYTEKGYIPMDIKIGEACSRTLDFAFADAAAAKVAEALGHADEAKTLRARSDRALRSMYDPNNGLMGHRLANGNFKAISPSTWGECYTEGSAWHHSFPPFNLPLLEELHGSRKALLQKLRQMFTSSGDFGVGSYGGEIHEMREMRMLGLGQYAHNNQPVHHLPYLFAKLGQRTICSKLVRRIMKATYTSQGFAGDEDNGEMGSWYILSALGLFSVAPGTTDEYVLSSTPIFKRVRLRELNVTLEAPGADQHEPMLSRVLWQSQPVLETGIPYSFLRQGGTLHFECVDDNKLPAATTQTPASQARRADAHPGDGKLPMPHSDEISSMRGAGLSSDSPPWASLQTWAVVVGPAAVLGLLLLRSMRGRSGVSRKKPK